MLKTLENILIFSVKHAKIRSVEALTVESLLPFSILFSARSAFEAVHSGSFDEIYYFLRCANMSNNEIC